MSSKTTFIKRKEADLESTSSEIIKIHKLKICIEINIYKNCSCSKRNLVNIYKNFTNFFKIFDNFPKFSKNNIFFGNIINFIYFHFENWLIEQLIKLFFDSEIDIINMYDVITYLINLFW